MFTKPKFTGSTTVQQRRYKKVIDWEAVGGALVIGVILLAIFGAMAG